MANLFDSDEPGLFDDSPTASLKRLRGAVGAFINNDNLAQQSHGVRATARLLLLLLNKQLQPHHPTSTSEAVFECALEGVIYATTGKHLPPEALFRD
jgi:hypothetical protein